MDQNLGLSSSLFHIDLKGIWVTLLVWNHYGIIRNIQFLKQMTFKHGTYVHAVGSTITAQNPTNSGVQQIFLNQIFIRMTVSTELL